MNKVLIMEKQLNNIFLASKICFVLVIHIFLRFANGQHVIKSQKISCSGLIFNHVYYDKKYVICNLGRPYNLMHHKFTDTIFFSHTVEKDTEVDFSIMSCTLDKKTCQDVEGVPGGYAIAYDAGNDDIFMGGHDGIYKYNFLTKKADYFSEKGKSIWALFVRKNFYYIEYPAQKLHVYKNDKFVVVAEAMHVEIDEFFVSKYGDIYFANKTALFKVTKPDKEVIVLNDELVIRQITEDNYGDVYFCANDGIYVEDKAYNRVTKLADIDQAFGLTFDTKDHVIYSDKDCIYRLVPSPNSDVCYHAMKSHKEAEHRRNMLL